MAGPIRTIYTELRLRADKAFKGLKAYDAAWKALDKSIATVATGIEKSADRAAAAMAKLAAGAADVRDATRGRGGGGSGGGKAPGYGTKASAFNPKSRGRRGGTDDVDLGGYANAAASGLDKVADAGKKAAGGVSALSVAAGNLISTGIVKGVELIAGGLKGAADAAIKFESSFADVKKVLPESMDTAKVKELEQGLLNLGPAVGVLPNDLAELTAALAQSGIAGDQLLTVAEDAAKVSVAFDMSGKEAGHAIASIQAALGTTREETNSLFDSINQLSNGMNATAAQIVDVETRVGSVGRAMALSGETTAALGAALIATGASSDVAATGVRTFLARLGAGEAATDKQLKAFEALGLSAKTVAAELASGDTARAEKQIRQVIAAIQGLRSEERLPVLIEMFGSESIGTIGALATNVELLGQAFQITGDKTKAAGSVQREFENRSATTEHGINRLKAQIQVLAIELGNALLPTINEITAWLNSPEGKEWGKSAVEGLVGAVRSAISTFKEAWPTIQTVGQTIWGLVEALGGGKVALLAFGAILMATIGPIGTLLVGATALGGYLGSVFSSSVAESNERMEQMISNSTDVAKGLMETGRALSVTNGIFVEMGDSTDKARRRFAELMLQIAGTTEELEKFYAKERENLIRNGKITEEEDRKRFVLAKKAEEESRRMSRAKLEDDNKKRAREKEAGYSAKAAQEAADEQRFEALSAKRRKGDKLSPSEAKEYSKLSKQLDMPKEGKAPKPKKPRKLTQEEQQLAAMDPALREVLLAGGETMDNGRRKLHDDPLTKAAFKHARGDGERGSAGPGPSITNVYNNQNVQTSITQQIDARGSDSASQNLANAGTVAGNQAAKVVLTGISQVLSLGNAGGVMR